MRYRTIVVFFQFVFSSVSFGQSIDFGDDATQIKNLIEYSVRGSSNKYWDVKYYNGQVSEVISCCRGCFVVWGHVPTTNMCTHYIMKRGKLSRIATRYEDISKEKIEEIYSNSGDKIKIGGYYFSKNYKTYSQVYLAKDGYPLEETWQTNMSRLPSEIRSIVAEKIKLQAEIENQEKLAEKQRKQTEQEVKSKTYDIAKQSKYTYQKVIKSQKKKIKSYFKSEFNPRYKSNYFITFEDLSTQDQKYRRFNNTYNIHYKLEDHSRPSVDRGHYIQAGTYDIKKLHKVELVEGTDEDCSIMKRLLIDFPTIKVQGYEVMTEAFLDNVKIDFIRGITTVKVKNEKVSFVRDEPPVDLQEKIVARVKNLHKGKYLVTYEIGEIMGDEISDINFQR